MAASGEGETGGERGGTMAEPGYWSQLQRRQLNRRRVLAGAAWSGAAFASGGLLACGNAKSGERAPAPGSLGAAETPKPGGNLSVFVQTNYPLDPQKVSALAQQIPGGAMSRLFKYKTGLDPAAITNHDLEPDLGL